MLEAQDGNCECCMKELPYPCYLDHDHATSVLRGLVCPSCNTIIGRVERSRPLYVGAAMVKAYLSKYGKREEAFREPGEDE